jgi:hypothetical protein
VLTPFFVVYLAGSLIGFVVLAVAVFRAGSAPRWAAIALALAGLGIVVVDAGAIGGVILPLLLLVALVGCGILAGHDAVGSKSTHAARPLRDSVVGGGKTVANGKSSRLL